MKNVFEVRLATSETVRTLVTMTTPVAQMLSAMLRTTEPDANVHQGSQEILSDNVCRVRTFYSTSTYL